MGGSRRFRPRGVCRPVDRAKSHGPSCELSHSKSSPQKRSSDRGNGRGHKSQFQLIRNRRPFLCNRMSNVTAHVPDVLKHVKIPAVPEAAAPPEMPKHVQVTLDPPVVTFSDKWQEGQRRLASDVIPFSAVQDYEIIILPRDDVDDESAMPPEIASSPEPALYDDYDDFWYG